MKRKVFSIMLALVLVLSFSLVTAVPATAYSYDDYTNAITKTANRLADLQGTNGGWDWIVTGLTAHSEGYPSPVNLFGVTALGLIDAYEVTGDEAYKTKAGNTADHLLSGSAYFSFDYRFLMEYAVVSNNSSYSNSAIADWEVTKTGMANDPKDRYADGKQEVLYDYMYNHYGTDGGTIWQCADYGLAALAMGDTSWASNMATVLAGHLNGITDTDIYRFIGWGKALELLNAVDSTLYDMDISNLITKLMNSQAGDGSWGVGGNPEGYAQDAAYAIMGLAAAGGANAIVAAEEGANWLVTNQGYSGIVGGWNNSTNNIEYSETDSEALQAIKSVLDISGSVSMSGAYIPKIGISVTPLSVDFGSVVPDIASGPQTVTVTNEGNVAEDFSTSIIDESTAKFYTNNLYTNTNCTLLATSWTAESVSYKDANNTITSDLYLKMPTDTPPGTYTATLVFWAEMH